MRGQLLGWLLLCLGLALTGCAGETGTESDMQAEPVVEETAGVAQATASSQYQEAPMLAEMVAAGELPPVNERLPEEPFVVGPGVLITEEDLPVWEPGRYGGTLQAAHGVVDWSPDFFVMINEPLVAGPGISPQNIQGNVVQEFEVNADRTQFTFFMRKGLKWSDGVPVTTEDIRFTYEDVLLNERLNPSLPVKFKTGGSPNGEPMQLEIVDDYTFTITFAEPYGGFLRQITMESWSGYPELLKPAHYLRQFHPSYTPMEDLQPLLEAQGLEEEWWQLFDMKDCARTELPRPQCVGFPALTPWVIQEAEAGVLSFVRNPYYFKVDVEGKQLPYIDRLISTQEGDVEMVNLKVMTGDVDYLRESTSLVKVPLYKENEEAGGFRTILLDMNVDPTALYLNFTYDDPVWRELVRDIRFREAISIAINRDEIIDSIYFGFASLPLETVGEQYSRYDPDAANQLLDDLGMDERGPDGFRLGPDGNPFTIFIDHANHTPDIGPVTELIAEHLKEVGVNVQVKTIDAGLWGQYRAGNELMATTWWAHGLGSDNHWTSALLDDIAPLWHNWHTSGGTQGEEPPAWAKQAYELDVARWSSVTGSEEYYEIREQGMAWNRDNLTLVTVVEDVKSPMIVSARLHNIPTSGQAIAANFSAEQFWFDEE